jgi:hypothetical protein
MNNSLILIKIKERLNKLDSDDYLNIEPYQFIEAFNKAQDMWVRRRIEGINQTRTGAESTIRVIDDLQVLLRDWSVPWADKGLYWESSSFPADYLDWCRLSAYGQDICKDCPPRRLVIFMGNEADVDMYLVDENRKPDYYWATTFATIRNKRFRIWTGDSFNITDPVLTYYKTPVHIQIAGVTDPDNNTVSTTDVLCELPDSVIELVVDEAAGILAGDMESWNQKQRLETSLEHNT